MEALCGVPDEEGLPVKTHPFLCGKEGVELIKKDIEENGINTLVIAACSRRAKTDVFDYDVLNVVLERVNIREHVAWCQPAKEEDTQMMADDYLRMGVVKAKKMEPPEPFQEEINKGILVVGGGLTVRAEEPDQFLIVAYCNTPSHMSFPSLGEVCFTRRTTIRQMIKHIHLLL